MLKSYVKYTVITFLLVISSFFICNEKVLADGELTFTNSKINEGEDGSGYTIDGTTLTIHSPGDYDLSGTSNNGRIEIEEGVSGVFLNFNSLRLSSYLDSPILFKGNNEDCSINLKGTSSLTDNTSSGNETDTAAIMINGNSEIWIYGDGTLNIYGNAQDGIYVGAGSELSAYDSSVSIDATNYGINSLGSVDTSLRSLTIESDNNGINILGESLERGLSIYGGIININSEKSGINSLSEVMAYGDANVTIHSVLDAIVSNSDITIESGNFDITTFGGHNATGFDSYTMSAKGITTNDKAEIRIYDGNITLDTIDDAINSSGDVYISEGTINIQSGDDAIFSKGSLNIGEYEGLERNPTITINNSYEGLEGRDVAINSGKVYVNAIDDGISSNNGSSHGNDIRNDEADEFDLSSGWTSIDISGGKIYVDAGSDGIDSSGDIMILGGEMEIWGQGAEGNNSPIDYDGRLEIDSAKVFAAGTDGVQAIHSNIDEYSNEYVISNNSFDQGAKVYAKNGSTTLYSATAPKNIDYTFYYNPNLNNSAQISETGSNECTGNAWTESWGEPVITTSATYLEKGVKSYTSNCGNVERVSYPFEDISGDYYLDSPDDYISLDGDNDGTVTVYFKAVSDVTFNQLEANLSVEEDNDNNFEIVNIESPLNSGDISLNKNTGVVSFNNSNGYSISEGEEIFRVTYKIGKNTPTGDYSIILGSDTYNSMQDKGFVLYSRIMVKREDDLEIYFVKDEGVEQINWYKTRNYSNKTFDNYSEDSESAFALDPSTGIKKGDGTDELNFEVILKDGYVLSEIMGYPYDKYSDIKGPGETNNPNTYRITGVTRNIDLSISTKQANAYTSTFITDENVESIDNYYSEDYTNISEGNISNALIRNSSTGEIDLTGNGEVNFKVNMPNEYKVSNIIVDGIYKSIEDPLVTGKDNVYRVTKVSGDISVNITTKARVAITPDITGYETSYAYTGSKIEPDVVVKTDGTDTVLSKGIDYTVEYGDNTEVGTNSGTITIKPISSSDYMFDSQTINFDIDKYELTENNVLVDSSIVYTGETLTPEVTVVANGNNLIKDTDYTIEYSNQDGQMGENITITVEGKGNYKTTNPIVKTVLISGKRPYVLDFGENPNLTKEYGDTYTKAVTVTEGDGNITYSSSNTDVATINSETGEVHVVGIGEAVITATASETAAYEETQTSYLLKAEKRNITISSASVASKVYDGNSEATVTNIEFEGVLDTDSFVKGTDYSVSAAFTNETTEARVAVVTVELLSENIKSKYVLLSNTYNAKATISPLPLSSNNVTLEKTSYNYDGRYKRPIVTVKVNNKTLIEKTDYTVEYSPNNRYPGTATVTVIGKGNYSGTVPKTFKIVAKKITSATLSGTTYTYTGKVITPKVTVKSNNTTLSSSDYKVTYSAVRKGVGTYTVTITGKGSYTGTIKKTFNIIPKTTNIKKLTGKTKKIKVKWTKGIVGITDGYQIRYGRKANFSDAKIKTVKGQAKYKKTIKKLKKNKKYYVQIRVYKVVSGKTYYSSWSKTKSVKTK